ncbi:MAG TPA: PAS domain S-box protein, partial [Thermomicrobiales bacterium]|nr:PAS domain S-box protein [Thermomicrobiales bacterium]
MGESLAAFAAEESGGLFRLLVESVADYAIFLLDPAGRVRTWNAGARRIKGYAAEEIVGRHFS